MLPLIRFSYHGKNNHQRGVLVSKFTATEDFSMKIEKAEKKPTKQFEDHLSPEEIIKFKENKS